MMCQGFYGSFNSMLTGWFLNSGLPHNLISIKDPVRQFQDIISERSRPRKVTFWSIVDNTERRGHRKELDMKQEIAMSNLSCVNNRAKIYW